MADAETYDSYLVPAIFDPWSRDLIKRALVWKGDRVLDVACGTGIVACRIAGTGAAVTGLDIDASRLERARTRASEEAVTVKWVEGSGETLPFRQPAFDLVTCQQGLQFMTDRAKAVREMRRVIVPGGRAVLACWLPVDQQGAFAVIDEIAASHTGTRHAGPTHPGPFSFGDEAALTKLLVDAKFFAISIETVTRQVRVPDPARFATMALTTVSGKPEEELGAAIADGVQALAPFLVDDAMQFQMKSLLAVARVKT